MAAPNTSRYLALFIAEGTEHLEALGREMVALEKEPTAARVDSLFRHAHSVKGMASAMGFDGTARLAHRLEDLLSAIRGDVSRFDRSIGDLVLQATDGLLTHVKAAAEGQAMPDATVLVEQLSVALSRVGPRPSSPLFTNAPSTQPAPVPPPSSPRTPAAPSPSRPVAPAAENPPAPAPPAQPAPPAPAGPAPDLSLPPRFLLKLRVSPAASQPGVRGFLAYKRISTLGNVFNLKPPLDDVKAGRFPTEGISLELETEQNEAAITKTLKAIADVELLGLSPIVAQSAPPPAKPPEPEGPRVLGQEPARTVRVKTELLDHLLDTAGELLLAAARFREVGKSLPEVFRPPLDEEVDRLHALVRSLHDKVMQSRMMPIAVVTDRLPRAARDIARKRGRDLDLAITGADIELDRAIVDELADPVLHLLRNAIDHGLESPEERTAKGKHPRGRISVAVRRANDRVILEVEDDGRGLDVERLRTLAVERGLLTAEAARALSERETLMLCCLPGLSTATDVTDISGRGVGMDAVKRAVEAVGGSLDIETRPGRGSRFRLSLPLTVAMVNLLLVGVGEEVYGLPIAKVSGVVETPRATLPRSEALPVLPFGAQVVAVHELAALLRVPASTLSGEVPLPFVVVEADEGKVALAVDRLFGQEEVVLKGLTKPLDLVPGLAGVTILGNGRPVFILDVARLVPA